jgi:hypothetical protein
LSTRFGDRPDRHLRRQPELVPQVRVDELLHRHLVRDAMSEGDFGGPVGGGVARPYRRQQDFSLLGARGELRQLRYQHITNSNNHRSRKDHIVQDCSRVLLVRRTGLLLCRTWLSHE